MSKPALDLAEVERLAEEGRAALAEYRRLDAEAREIGKAAGQANARFIAAKEALKLLVSDHVGFKIAL